MQVTYTHKKISFGARTVAKQVELLLATPAFHTIVPRIDSSLRGGSSWGFKKTSPCQHHRTHKKGFWYLDSGWCNPICCRHLGVNHGWKISLSLSLSLISGMKTQRWNIILCRQWWGIPRGKAWWTQDNTEYLPSHWIPSLPWFFRPATKSKGFCTAKQRFCEDTMQSSTHFSGRRAFLFQIVICFIY